MFRCVCIIHVSDKALESTRARTRFVVPTGLSDVHPRVVMYLKDISCEDGKCMEMVQNRVRRRATASGQHSCFVLARWRFEAR
jgi:hypothetical protein